MAKYMLHASYTAEGVKGLLKEGGTSRRKLLEKLVKGLGGKLEAFYFAFGETDVVLVVDLPDHASVAALSLTTGGSGAVSVRTTVLITPEEIDEATKKSVAYRAPGA